MEHTLEKTNQAIRFFNENAASYDRRSMNAGWLTAPRTLYVMQSPYFVTHEKLLDLGCGTGLSAMAYKDAGTAAGKHMHITGLDGAAKMLQQAKRNRYMDMLIELDLAGEPLALPFDDRSVPHVVACGLLPYIGNLKPLFDDIARVLSLGGTFAFDYHPLTKEAKDSCVKKGSHYADRQTLANAGVEYYLHDEVEILRILNEAGLVVDGKKRNYPVMSVAERGEILFNGIVAMKA